MLLGSMAQNAFAQKIEIKGTVRDASDKSIEYVNVVLQTIDSTFVAGVTTSPEGEFIFKNTATGDYRLVLSSIGYNTGYILIYKNIIYSILNTDPISTSIIVMIIRYSR